MLFTLLRDIGYNSNSYPTELRYMRTLIALLLLSSAAVAGQHDPEWNPPARYDHAFQGELKVIRVPVQDVSKTCQAMWHFFGSKKMLAMPNHGCAKRQDDSKGPYCVVVIPRGPVQLATPAAVLRHEVGHCNGWSASHPQ
jgi:hypothetical protein